MKSIHVLLVITICVIFYSCESLIETLFGKNEELTFIKTEYVGDQLKIDGYYYCKYEGYGSISFDIIFYYKNGIVLTERFISDVGGLNNIEKEFINGNFEKYANKHQSVWALFTIDSTRIEYEKLHDGHFRAMIDSGKIINDTTFVILKRKSSYGTYGIKEKALQDTFRLKPFSPKPDSTNIYIK